jgi:hypothetical protein
MKDTPLHITESATIKAMEIHANRGECSNCPYSGLPMEQCQKQMFTNAVALIKQYRAEIDRLEKVHGNQR